MDCENRRSSYINSFYKNEFLKHQIQFFEEDMKKLKKEMYDKDTQNYSLNLQVSELTKSNKYLNDLVEILKCQIKKYLIFII